MNIMRKLWVSGAGSNSGIGIGGNDGNNGPFHSSGTSAHSISLGLMHLRKLFGDYQHSPSDDKVYKMLPLFIKVFNSSSASDMVERFPEINSFCQAVAKLMVTEVRKRATNQVTEAAAISIIRFFEAASINEEDSHGWTLLTTLNLLAAGDENLILILTAASVPSTLVKCLYLFFDLPEIQPPERKGPTSDFSPMERRLLLQKIFVQLLIRLSSHPAPAEELAKMDDLALLFSAVTSWCPPQNAMWRKSSSEVLMTISTQIIHSAPVLSYIHNKGCIGLCVENLRRGSHLTPLEVTEMVLTLFCFLKDSSDLSQILLDDFKSAQGYQFFVEILLRLESDLSSESQEAIRNLVLVVSSLTMCGFCAIKPNTANMESLFSLPTFQLPPPGVKGCTVRNLQAFHVLQSVFTKSTTPFLSGVVLDAVFSVFKADPSNYFIVDSVLPQMAEKLITKTPEVHFKFLEIVEFVVFQLQFTPCKELIAISRILKNDLSEANSSETLSNNSRSGGGSNRNSVVLNITQWDLENEIKLKLLCVKTLLNLAKHNALFKDVFREIGILEALITCLHRFGSDMQDVKNIQNVEGKEEVGLVVIELLTLILTGTTANVNIFRENGGPKCALQLATSQSTRGPALALIQQLLMTPGGEEDISTVLVALHSTDMNTSLGLKIDILTALLNCFRESHRARCNFRKAGGFLYLMSVLVSMEGLLLQPGVSSSVIRERMQMVQLIFTAFALSMRFEPANAKLFHQEICLPSLADTLRLIGCFSREFKQLPANFPVSNVGSSSSVVSEEDVQLFHSIFLTSPANLDPQSYQGKVPFTLVLCVFLFRLLYDLAIDAFERNFPPSVSSVSFRSSPRKQLSGDTTEGAGSSEPCSPHPPPTPGAKKLSVGSLNLTPPTPEPVLIHSAVVIVMVKLIPSIWQSEDTEDCDSNGTNTSIQAACQLYCAELIKSLVRNEKNQQLMAQTGLVDEILERCAVALSDESHYLHSPIHYAFERVATHSLSPKDFRRFLRLGNPLNCERLSSTLTSGSTCGLSVSRVKSLVSMTMSKNGAHHHHGTGTQSQTSSHTNCGPTPPFVEFDMSAEGFGALFLPSLAPHNVSSGNEFGSTGLLATGIGMGTRVFPGITGMSFSTWFSVDKFSDPRVDPHPIRLLTIIKEVEGAQRLCLCIVVSARDKAMIVSTRESPVPASGIGEWEPEGSLSGSVRVWCPELLHENQWHHLFFAFSTSSVHSFTVYVNGRLASTGKLEYPHRTKSASYSAFIGTKPAWRKTSRLTWRQGVAHFFEDWVPGAQTVHSIYKLGPEYPGSWQAVKIQSETAGTLIAEDKIIFGLNALAVSQLTLAKIRKIYSKTDAKAIAKQLNLSSHENATPISILHNSAAHLIGPARTLGGVTIGYIGVRVYAPLPVSKSILSIGGIQVLIGLIAMANTGEMLYASLKAFVCVIKSNSSTNLVSETAWQMLGYLLARKKHLLTMRVLHLVFGLVSSDSSGGVSNLNKESRTGFVELLGDIDIWCPFPITATVKSSADTFDSGKSTPDPALRKQGSSEEPTPSCTALPGLSTSQKFDFLQANIDLEKALYEHFLQILNDDPKNALEVLREANIVPKLLRRLTMSPSAINQGPIFLLLSHLLAHKGNASAVDLITFGHFIAGTLPPLTKTEPSITNAIELRNKGLQLIHSLMYTGKVLNVGFCDELVHRLGFDFVLLFATPNLHSSTLLWALRILLLLITSSPTLKNKFRDGSQSAWCFGKTAIAAQQSGGLSRNSYGLLPLKRQETRDGEDSSSGGTPVSGGGPVSAIAGGLTGKTGKGLTGGWARLSWLLALRCEDVRTEGPDVFPSETWLILCAMILSQPCRNVSLKVCSSNQLTLDSIWNYVFAVPGNRMASSLYGKVTLCPDAIITLLTLIRCFITAESAVLQDKNIPSTGSNSSIVNPTYKLHPNSTSPASSPSYHSDIASCLVQFLCYLYSHTPEFQPVFTSTEVLSALAASVMPIDVRAGIGVLIIDNALVLEGTDLEEVKLGKEKEATKVPGNDVLELGIDASEIETKLDSSEDVVDATVHREQLFSPVGVAPPLQQKENLMNHSAKKIILDFLRMLIIDWMSSSTAQSQSKTGVTMNIVIDTVLEAGHIEAEVAVGNNSLFPSNGQYSAALLTQFHTNLLGTLLDHLIAFDLDRMTGYLPAVAHFLSRLVDKLWLESFARDPQVVFDFILILISHCKTKRVPPTTTDMIYNSLNRVVLFILSRKSNQWDKVEALKKIRGVRSVIFGSGNHQQEFFGCLVYVIMQLVDGLPISLESGNRTQWHVRVGSVPDEDAIKNASVNKYKSTRSNAALDNEISSTAEKVWEDLFISKKPMVEDVFKITFPSPKPPSLSSLRDDLGDCAYKLWLAYVASETNPGAKKSSNAAAMSQSWEIHQQLQSKLQKVTGGLTRLAGRSGIRKESEKEKTIKDVVSQWNEAKKCQVGSNKHLMIVKDVLEVHEKCHLENIKHLKRYVRDTLLPQLEHELTRERGIWGPTQPSHLDKWMLDTTEGPSRMRKKLMRNDMFYMHYPYSEQMVPSGTSGSTVSSPRARRINPPISRDAKEFHKKFKHQTSFINEACAGLSVDELDDSIGPSGSSSSDPNLSPKATGTASVDDPFCEGSMDSTSDPDNQSMLFRLIGTAHEKISQIFRVAQIQGLDTAEGLLLFGKDHFYLISGFTILAKTREIKDMYYLPPNMYEPILPPQCYGTGPTPAKPRSKTHSCWKFSYEDVREVHKRRYLLQPIALEIFCSDGINYLLAFPRKVRNVVFQKFTSVSKNLSDSGTDAKQSVAGQRRSTSVEQSTGIFSSLIGDTTVTQRWVRGEISNFQYLMYMNTLAGRSYNDLMQYPVFPWILADYDSPFLDFNDPQTFRDLSKPMGAQSNVRLVQFVKRFKEWDDPHGETPPYHYGTHYSSAMIVCSYLVRMEPFAQHFLRLQGGHFDLADRMFHSIKEAWTSASIHNMADVKELIPEFFYLPEFLQNSNNFDLGFKQNGVALGDVLLPPWAKNDPKEFIRVHREALESDYVSQHLHEWIDLVFGYKQQGQPAVDSVNVFHHLFYEGNVDIYTIDDPLKKNATIGFINNFGQIPKQLFKKPHPMKRVNSSGTSLTSGLGIMKQYNILEAQNSLLALAATAGSSSILQSSIASAEKLFYHYVDHLRPTLAPIKELKGPVGQILPLDRPNVIIAVEQNKFLMSPSKYISWGFADGSVRVSNVDTDRPQFIWEQCQQQLWMGNIGEIVTCTAASEKIAITGSTNTVISVWEFVEKEFRLKSHLYGHSEPITCLACSPSYNIIVSGSKDLTCIIWDLARLSFVRQLVSHASPIDAVGVNELTGDIATCDGSWLRLWSINGELIGQIDTAGVGGGGGMSQGILCVNFSHLNEWDADNVVITGSTDGIVRMWSVRHAQVPEEDVEGNRETEGLVVVNHSLTDDSSMITGSDTDEPPDDLNDMNQSDDDSTQDRETEGLSVAEVFDPDKDRNSLEDLREDSSDQGRSLSTEKQTQLEKVKNSVRRQRALSSGTPSSPRHDSTSGGAKLRSNSSLNTAEKKAKRKSDIPRQASNTSVAAEGAERNEKTKTRPSIRSSKSENSLSFEIEESFDILSETEVAALRKEEQERKMSYGSTLRAAHALKSGHVWQRRLVFRGKLTMHTAYDRQDNKEPASITAISVSRDHRNVYVGDARGRVFSWTCSDSAAGRVDHWQRDDVTDCCGTCKTKFTMTERKHHCRSCGSVFCSKCSRFESEIFRLRILRPVRVCQPCFVQLKGDVRGHKVSTSDL